ncbi:hypothetical protein ABPG74_021772 [Tetrahymena malaccensis]
MNRNQEDNALENNEVDKGDRSNIDLWSHAEESELKQGFAKNLEKTLVVVGDKGSGKTSFVNILKNMQQVDDRYIPTVGLDYQYVRRTNANRKELIHSYELGGGKEQSKMITIPISKQNFRDAFYILVLDLSKPHQIIESATFWFEEIRRQIDQFNSTAFTTPEENDQRSNFEFAQQARFESHPDKNRVKILPIQTIVIGMKYDIFEKTDSENRKWLTRTLRYLAHVNGASLYFASSKNNDLFQNMRSIMSNALFGKTLAQYYQSEHLRPIEISSSKDELAKMGLPQISGNMTYIEAFKKVIQETFPENKGAQNDASYDPLRLMEKFPEARIDSIRAEKDKEMKVISKEFMSYFDNTSPVKLTKKQLQQEYEELFETSQSYQPDSQNQIQYQDNSNYQYDQKYAENTNQTRIKPNNQTSTYQGSAPQQIGGSIDPQRVNPYTKNTVRSNQKQINQTSNQGGTGRLSGMGGLPNIN